MKSHDLSLSKWGPYNKNYLGISHIADKKRGVSFDINLFPGFYRRSVLLVKDICDSGTKIMKSSADLSHFLYRYELLWKDELYIDADYRADSDGNLKIECSIVNNTDVSQSVTINACASVHFPTNYRNNLDVCSVSGKSMWIDAVDYSQINTVQTLACDGLKLGERRVSGFVGASGISGKYFDEGGYLIYNFSNTTSDEISVRYIAQNNVDFCFEINGKMYDVTLEKSDKITLSTIKTNENTISSLKIYLKSGEYELDGFIVGKNDLEFVKYTDSYVPKIKENAKSLELEYEFGKYNISWDYDDYEIREFIGEDIGMMLTDSIHNHVSKRISGAGCGHFANIFIRPVFVDAKSEKTVTFYVKSNSENIYANNENAEIKVNSDGQKYKLSQDIMTANTLTNVVFPIYCQGEYIRHNTPGRLWDSLYTWDSGFIGMGLNAVDKKRAVECLSAYLTEKGSIHSPFIFHGSVVPTQMLLYLEIWNSSTDEEFLRSFYPYMVQYYNFFKKLCDNDYGLGKTWDIFYNSGGWDDYPPQKYVIDNKLKAEYYPVITTSMIIMCAKIMKNIAEKLGKDTECFENDIEKMTKAVQKYMWDDKTGYFGYVRFNSGKSEILKHDGKINFNMGLDGAYPYIAGICTDNQKKRILDNIKTGLMTKYGVSVVDTRAPYYRKDGYWNGSIWMPHQWILWKALLDEGEISLANKIAKTALEVWKNEVELTYNCYEHFMIENGRGAGFHQFSGLSTPVLMWYKAYYCPKTVSVGFSAMLDSIKWNSDGSEFECNVLGTSGNGAAIICLNEKYDYVFKSDGEKIPAERITNGAYFIKLKVGRIKVKKE